MSINLCFVVNEALSSSIIPNYNFVIFYEITLTEVFNFIDFFAILQYNKNDVKNKKIKELYLYGRRKLFQNMVNSIKGKYQTGGYSTGSYNMGRYAKYDEPVDAKEFIIPLINQYIKKKSEIQNFRLGKKHEEFFAIMKKILDTLKEIDKQQAEILIEKYEQLLKEDKEDKINKKYMGLLDRKLPNIELKLEYNHEADFLLRLDYFIQWLFSIIIILYSFHLPSTLYVF